MLPVLWVTVTCRLQRGLGALDPAEGLPLSLSIPACENRRTHRDPLQPHRRPDSRLLGDISFNLEMEQLKHKKFK